MAICKACGKNTEDGADYCKICADKRRAEESYLDSLLHSVVQNEKSPAPAKQTTKVVDTEILHDAESVDEKYDIMNDMDDSYLDEIFKEAESSYLDEDLEKQAELVSTEEAEESEEQEEQEEEELQEATPVIPVPEEEEQEEEELQEATPVIPVPEEDDFGDRTDGDSDDINAMLGDLFGEINPSDESGSQQSVDSGRVLSVSQEDEESTYDEKKSEDGEEDDDIVDFWNSINSEPELFDNEEASPVSQDEIEDESDIKSVQGNPTDEDDYLDLIPDIQSNGDESASAENENGAENKASKKKKGLFSKLFGNVKEDLSPEEIEARKEKAISKLDEKDRIEAEKAEKDKTLKLEAKKKKEENDKAAKEQKAAAQKQKQERAKEDAIKKKELKDKKTIERQKILEEIEQNEGKINKVGASLVFVVFALVLCVIAIGTSIYTYRVSIANAAYDFDLQRYKEAYDEVYGLDIKEEDIELYEKVLTVMYVNKQLYSYANQIAVGKEAEALDSLIKGLKRYEKYIYYGTELGIRDDLRYVRTQILNELSATFHISEDEAYDLLDIGSQEEYSERIITIAESL